MVSETGQMLPLYECTKKVWALKIKEIKPLDNGGALLVPEPVKGVEYATQEVDKTFMQRHRPQIGGYLVVYKDGYRSFSPCKAFEEGYTLIEWS